MTSPPTPGPTALDAVDCAESDCAESRPRPLAAADRTGPGKLPFLSEEWMAERMRIADSVAPTPGVDLVIQHEVLGGPRGPVYYVDHVRDGRLESCYLGRDESAHATITNTWSDELGVMRGELDPFDIIISGRVQVTGDQSLLMGIIPILQRPHTLLMASEMSDLTVERSADPDGSPAAP